MGGTTLISLLRATMSEMMADLPLMEPRSYRRLLRLFLGYVAVVTLVYGLLTLRFYGSWTTADWLINYAGGFVRRGLPGQAAFVLGQVCHVSPVFFVAVLVLVSYAVLLAASGKLAWNARPSWWCLALLVSPATLSFQILDATGGFRKEILFLATLAGVLAFAPTPRHPYVWIPMMGTPLAAALVLSHEGLLCFLPYLGAALYIRGLKPRQVLTACTLPFVLGLFLAVISLRHLGDLPTEEAICASLGYPLLPQGKAVCAGGAIGYLAYTPAMARARTWAAVRGDLYFVVYPLASCLALWPVVLGSLALVRRGARGEVRAIWVAAAVSTCGSLPLFVYAEDWGRWIYIHIFSLALLMLSLGDRSPSAEELISRAQPQRGRHRAAWYALAAYATLWSLPHVPSRTPPFGYLGLLHYLGLHL